MNNSALTAMTRSKPSRPLQDFVPYMPHLTALGTATLLDYGCGKGSDVAWVNGNTFISASGYDPYQPGWDHQWKLVPGVYDAVTCIYVLNTISSQKERANVVARATTLLAPGGLFLIATRAPHEVADQARRGRWKPEGYGFRTKRNTFQEGLSSEDVQRFVDDTPTGDFMLLRDLSSRAYTCLIYQAL